MALKEERAAAALEAALAKLRAEIEPRKKPDLGAQRRVGGRACGVVLGCVEFGETVGGRNVGAPLQASM